MSPFISITDQFFISKFFTYLTIAHDGKWDMNWFKEIEWGVGVLGGYLS
jgi:hypothetical protein